MTMVNKSRISVGQLHTKELLHEDAVRKEA